MSTTRTNPERDFDANFRLLQPEFEQATLALVSDILEEVASTMSRPPAFDARSITGRAEQFFGYAGSLAAIREFVAKALNAMTGSHVVLRRLNGGVDFDEEERELIEELEHFLQFTVGFYATEGGSQPPPTDIWPWQIISLVMARHVGTLGVVALKLCEAHNAAVDPQSTSKRALLGFESAPEVDPTYAALVRATHIK